MCSVSMLVVSTEHFTCNAFFLTRVPQAAVSMLNTIQEWVARKLKMELLFCTGPARPEPGAAVTWRVPETKGAYQIEDTCTMWSCTSVDGAGHRVPHFNYIAQELVVFKRCFVQSALSFLDACFVEASVLACAGGGLPLAWRPCLGSSPKSRAPINSISSQSASWPRTGWEATGGPRTHQHGSQ